MLVKDLRLAIAVVPLLCTQGHMASLRGAEVTEPPGWRLRSSAEACTRRRMSCMHSAFATISRKGDNLGRRSAPLLPVSFAHDRNSGLIDLSR
jgi:hypothetical protein